MILKNIPVFQINLPSVSNQSSQCFNEYLQEAEKKGEALFPYLFYPFDFTSMHLSTELGTDYCGSNGYIQRLGCLLACRIIGIYNFRLINVATSFPMPFPSFPITIKPLADNGCSYMFFPSRNVPNTGVSPSDRIKSGREV